MKEEKNIVLNIVLTVITCGIYGLVWFVQMTDDAKELSNDTEMVSGGLAVLLTIITCGLYGFYWCYKMGKMIASAQSSLGLNANDNSILYIVFQAIGLGIVNYCIMQSDLNEIIRVKNNGMQQAPQA